jgi:hypothetical protein
LPLLVGHNFQAHEFWGILAEASGEVRRMDGRDFFVVIF